MGDLDRPSSRICSTLPAFLCGTSASSRSFFSLSAPLFWFNYTGRGESAAGRSAGVADWRPAPRRAPEDTSWPWSLAGVIPLIKLTGGLLGLRSGAGIPGGQGDPRSETGEERNYSGCWSCRWPPPGSDAGSCCHRSDLVPRILESQRGHRRRLLPAPCRNPETLLNSEVLARDLSLCIGAFPLCPDDRSDRAYCAWFFVALLTIPSAGQRKSMVSPARILHVINFFCFSGSALALISFSSAF